MTTIEECSVCVTRLRENGSSVKVGYLWHGGQEGDWERCYHCDASGIEPMSGYQVEHNGRVRQIEELTREELISELILSIDKLEEIDDIHGQLSTVIENWRSGK